MGDSEDVSSRTQRTKQAGAKTSVDVTNGTKRRVDAAVSIRQKSRLEMMTKKRREDSDDDGSGTRGVGNNIKNNNNGSASNGGGGGGHMNPNARSNNNSNDNNNSDDNEPAVGRNFPSPGTEEYNQITSQMFQRIAEYVGMMQRHNPLNVISDGVWSIRRLLCHPERSPVQELVQNGGIERLIDLLDAPDPNIQFNAAWSLTNIASGATSYAALIISHGAIPKFIGFLRCNSEKLREQAAWCLGNMAGDGQPIRDEILGSGVMEPLLDCINNFDNAPATMRNAVWLLAQLCRNKPSPAFDVVEPCLPTVKRLLSHPMTEVQDDACWAVSYLSDGPPARIHAVQKYDVFPIVMQMLRSQRETVMLPAVRTFGNFSATNPEMTQIIINQGVLDFLGPLLDPGVSRQIRKEVCWLISNACAGYDNQVRAVMRAGLFPPVIRNIFAPEFEVRREAVWVVANATATADLDRIRFLAETCNVLDGLCNVLQTMDSRICNIALESIEAILMAGDTFRANNGGNNPYADRIEEIGGKDNIGRLRDHICHTVFVRSVAIMDRYFDDGWGATGDNDDFMDDDDDDNNNEDGDNNNNNNNNGNGWNNNRDQDGAPPNFGGNNNNSGGSLAGYRI